MNVNITYRTPRSSLCAAGNRSVQSQPARQPTSILTLSMNSEMISRGGFSVRIVCAILDASS